MAKKKVSELPAATALANGEEVPIVQGGVSKRATVGVHLPRLISGKVDPNQLPDAAGLGDMLKSAYDPANAPGQVLKTSDRIDEDDFASDSAVRLPSQQSTKAYIAAIIAALRAELANPSDTTGTHNIGHANPGGTKFGGATVLAAILDWMWENGVWEDASVPPVGVSDLGPTDLVVAIRASDGAFVSIERQLLLGEGSASVFGTALTSYTIDQSNLNGQILATGSADQVITIPAAGTLQPALLTVVDVARMGTGGVRIAGAAGMVVNGASAGYVDIEDRFGELRVKWIGANQVLISGGGGSAPVTGDTTAPTLTSSSPADDATNVLTSVVIELTFSEAVAFGSGLITLRGFVSGSWTDIETFDVATEVGSGAGQVQVTGGNKVQIRPTAALANARQHAVWVASTAVVDLAANAFAGIANDTTVSFTTVAAAPSGPTIIGSFPVDVPSGSGNETVSLSPIGALAENDVVYVHLGCDNTREGALPSGWSQIFSTGGAAPGGYTLRKVMGAVPDTSIAIPREFSRKSPAIVWAVRGAHAAMDGTPITTNGSTGAINPGAYTQTNASALRWIAATVEKVDVNLTAPAGWTLLQANNADLSDGSGASVAVAYQAPGGSAGAAVDPAAFGGAGSNWWRAWHWADY